MVLAAKADYQGTSEAIASLLDIAPGMASDSTPADFGAIGLPVDFGTTSYSAAADAELAAAKVATDEIDMADLADTEVADFAVVELADDTEVAVTEVADAAAATKDFAATVSTNCAIVYVAAAHTDLTSMKTSQTVVFAAVEHWIADVDAVGYKATTVQSCSLEVGLPELVACCLG